VAWRENHPLQAIPTHLQAIPTHLHPHTLVAGCIRVVVVVGTIGAAAFVVAVFVAETVALVVVIAAVGGIFLQQDISVIYDLFSHFSFSLSLLNVGS